ncbi:MAG: cation transporter [Chloroflexi bacterium]|uniref:Cation transporter n=1 Tax=Candidatus Chlorohelix allophototropha TaxID=3003348 RepID=A0A8T7M563_9CHLR|nr:cation transporter [Chloroflexota bacterium]
MAQQITLDEHTHDHNHHHHQHSFSGAAFKIGFALTAGFVVIELVAGLMANSLALISDAGHNLTDALALAFSWWALRIARRAPNHRKTYGYHRAGILAATINAVTLILISIYIFYEGVQRFMQPPEVQGWTVLSVACIALIINLTVAWLLHHDSKDDLNTRSAYLHIVGDAAASVGVIIAGLIEIVIGWRYADPLISMLIGLFILVSSWTIIKEATNILLEGIPDGLDMTSLVRDLMKQPNVEDVHDLHVWTIGRDYKVLSCHLIVQCECSLQDANRTVHDINHMLEEQYHIHHATLQIESESCELNQIFCANPNARN